jgi:hypothetical protein
MRVPLAVIADYANLSIDGKLNIMGIFDTITARSFPAVHMDARLVVRFESDVSDRGGTKDLGIELHDADGNVLLSAHRQLDIPTDAPLTAALDHILELKLLRFDHAGDYAFRILVDGQLEGRVVVHLRQVPEAGSARASRSE